MRNNLIDGGAMSERTGCSLCYLLGGKLEIGAALYSYSHQLLHASKREIVLTK